MLATSPCAVLAFRPPPSARAPPRGSGSPRARHLRLPAQPALPVPSSGSPELPEPQRPLGAGSEHSPLCSCMFDSDQTSSATKARKQSWLSRRSLRRLRRRSRSSSSGDGILGRQGRGPGGGPGERRPLRPRAAAAGNAAGSSPVLCSRASSLRSRSAAAASFSSSSPLPVFSFWSSSSLSLSPSSPSSSSSSPRARAATSRRSGSLSSSRAMAPTLGVRAWPRAAARRGRWGRPGGGGGGGRGGGEGGAGTDRREEGPPPANSAGWRGYPGWLGLAGCRSASRGRPPTPWSERWKHGARREHGGRSSPQPAASSGSCAGGGQYGDVAQRWPAPRRGGAWGGD